MQPGARLRDELGEIDIYLFDQLLRGRLDGHRRVLDAGCGNGRNLAFLMRSGFETFGVDRDPAAIAAVRALAARLAPTLPPENFQTGEIDRLPLPDQHVDAVVCSAVLHFAEDPPHFARMMEEMWRVLRPGGLFFARLASVIGLEPAIRLDDSRRANLPDGTVRFLVDEPFLLGWGERLGAVQLDPLKTTNVQNQRCMTTWVLRRP